MTDFKVGDRVDYHSRIGGPVTSIGHVIRQLGELGAHPVAWLEGKSGCVSLRALTPHDLKAELRRFLRALTAADRLEAIVSCGSFVARKSIAGGGRVKFEYVSAENRKRPQT